MPEMLSRQLDKADYTVLWSKLLFSLYVVMYFFDGITRYKHGVNLLILITAIVMVVRDRKILANVFRSKAILLPITVLCYGIYSTLISADVALSLKYFNQHVLIEWLVQPLAVAIIISRFTAEELGRQWMFSLLALFVATAISEAVIYFNEYQQGIMPFSNYNHRFIIDALIFSLPALLAMLDNKSPKVLLLFVLASIAYALLLLGTLQRGAWVSVGVLVLLWCIFMGRWKFIVIAGLLAAAVVVGLSFSNSEHAQLINYKLHQFSSSHRFGNGTQGAALDMIKLNPVKGYGLGDKVYLKVYANNLDSHPQWFFKKPISPHNIYLSFWFSAGVLGIAALVFFFVTFYKISWQQWKQSTQVVRYTWLSLILIASSAYLTRGIFELTEFERCSLLVTLMIGMLASRKNKQLSTENA